MMSVVAEVENRQVTSNVTSRINTQFHTANSKTYTVGSRSQYTQESGHVRDFTRGARDESEEEKFSDSDSNEVSKNGGQQPQQDSMLDLHLFEHDSPAF